MAEETVEAAKKGMNFGFLWKVAFYLIILGAGVYGGTRLVQYKPDWFGLSPGAQQVQAEVDALIERIGKLISLPSDEKPTVATVTDASKIKDQPFFKDAQNGDKVLIYQKAAKAILYRESENRIIEVGAVNINNQPTVEATPSPSPQGKAKTPVKTASPTPTETPAGNQ